MMVPWDPIEYSGSVVAFNDLKQDQVITLHTTPLLNTEPLFELQIHLL